MKSKIIFIFLFLVVLLPLVGCNSAPSNKSWDNPEDFVSYDVQHFINLALKDNRYQIKNEYGEELLNLSSLILNSYSQFGRKPKIENIDRFADGCWATVSDTIIETNSAGYDETTYYYIFRNNQWKLGWANLKIVVGGVSQEIEFKTTFLKNL